MFNETVLKEIEDIKTRYPESKSALLPVLYVAQRELGWLSQEAISCVAGALNLPEAIVRGTGSFYSMFKHKPMGRHLVQLCTNVSCMVTGSDELVNYFKTKYGMEPDGTTQDGRFTLIMMECIGACGTAPAMLVNTDFYDSLTEQKIDAILDKYK